MIEGSICVDTDIVSTDKEILKMLIDEVIK